MEATIKELCNQPLEWGSFSYCALPKGHPGECAPVDVAAATPNRFVVHGVSVDRWQGSVLRSRQPQWKEKLDIDIQGASGQLRRKAAGFGFSAFRFDPHGQNFVVESVKDANLETLVRSWLGY